MSLFTKLSKDSLKIIDELVINGHPLPDELSNASLASEAAVFKAL